MALTAARSADMPIGLMSVNGCCIPKAPLAVIQLGRQHPVSKPKVSPATGGFAHVSTPIPASILMCVILTANVMIDAKLGNTISLALPRRQCEVTCNQLAGLTVTSRSRSNPTGIQYRDNKKQQVTLLKEGKVVSSRSGSICKRLSF